MRVASLLLYTISGKKLIQQTVGTASVEREFVCDFKIEGGKHQNLKSLVSELISYLYICSGKNCYFLSAFVLPVDSGWLFYFLQFYQITLKAGMNIDHVLELFLFVLLANIRKHTLNYLVGGNKVVQAVPREQYFHVEHQLAPDPVSGSQGV